MIAHLAVIIIIILSPACLFMVNYSYFITNLEIFRICDRVVCKAIKMPRRVFNIYVYENKSFVLGGLYTGNARGKP